MAGEAALAHTASPASLHAPIQTTGTPRGCVRVSFQFLPLFLHFSYHLELKAISASIDLVNWASMGTLISVKMKMDLFLF